MNTVDQIHYLVPEIMLAFTLCMTLVADLLTKGERSSRVGWMAILGLLATGWFLWHLYGHGEATVFGMVTVDKFSIFFKLFAVASLIVVILFTLGAKEIPKNGSGEFHFVLLSAGLGIFFLVSTYNLLLLYLALELLSISSYVLAGYLKSERRSGEAALKYVIFGALASGLMLYGLSLIYGLTGSLDIRVLGYHLSQHGPNVAIGLAIALSLVGFGYKISAVPFHFWTPDVYEGSPTPVTTFLAVASKAAAFGALLRFLIGGFLVPEGPGGAFQGNKEFIGNVGSLLALLSAITMTFGNLAALRQTSIKRMLAYSSIAHAGYILMGLAVMKMGVAKFVDPAFQSTLFYLVSYYFMNLGAFGCVIYFANQTGQDSLESLRGMGWKSPLAGACFVAFLLSLTGVPPTVGFFGKYYLILSAIDGQLIWLAIFVALNSVVSLFYYFRIAKALYLSPESEAKFSAIPQPAFAGLLFVLGAGTILFGLWAEPIRKLCSSSLDLLR